MEKNIRLIYCILGSVILALISPFGYDTLHVIPVVGFILSQLTYYVSAIGIILTIYFAINLIRENCRFKAK